MAIFGNKKKIEKKDKVVLKHRARTASTKDGVAHEIIRAPWFSEKALIVTEKGVYTFSVAPRATKAEIAGAIYEIYKVAPRKICVTAVPGKPKAMRSKRGTGHRAARRKAYVYLNAGDTIQFA